jgi:salicylate hydroxylase
MTTTSSSHSSPVIVVGGGVGGVATALALGRQGRAVTLLEQADQIGAIGYGVQLGPNVLPMLQQLGLAEAALAKAYLPTDITWYDLNTAQSLAHIPLQTEAFAARYAGSRYLAIHRVDLHELLLAACERLPNIQFNQSTAVTGYQQNDAGAQVTLEGGATLDACAVVVADGLRSRLRAQMHPSDTPQDTGYVAHRTIVPMADAPELARQRTGVTMWSGPGFHVIYYPLRARSELNIVVVNRMPPGLADDAAGYRAQMDRIMDGAQPEPREVIARVNLDRRWTIADRQPLRRWAEGRVTLLGDSAHATLQSLAQGAGMAIEDAVTLATLLERNGGDYAVAFQKLQRARFLRTARVQLESRALWETYHCEDVHAEVRAWEWGARRPEDFYRCLDWLWQPVSVADLT